MASERGSRRRRGSSLGEVAARLQGLLCVEGRVTQSEALAMMLETEEGMSFGQDAKTREHNLRRRVYDVLNIFVALGIVDKDEQRRFSWNALHPLFGPRHSDVIQTQRRIHNLGLAITQQQRQLEQQRRLLVALRDLVERNRVCERMLGPPDPDRVCRLPFVALATANTAEIACTVYEAERELEFTSDCPFTLHEDTSCILASFRPETDMLQ